MNIVVLGPGAVGSLWAYSLHQAGHSVSVYSRRQSPFIPLQVDQHPIISVQNNHLDSLRNADLLLVTVKAPQVAQALTSIKQEIDADCIVVLMHNGMGTAEKISQLLPNNPLLLATTTHGALRNSSEQVLHTGLGSTQIGGYNQTGMQCQFVTEVFHHALAHVEWNNQILDALWNKLAINCAINPLTAIHQIYNGQLAEPHYAEAIHAIIGEVSQVMNAEGVEVTEQQLEARIYHVIEATAKNHSSMQQDIFHQRQSEIDFITGYLLQKAQQHGISTPTNSALFKHIKQIEQSWIHE